MRVGAAGADVAAVSGLGSPRVGLGERICFRRCGFSGQFLLAPGSVQDGGTEAQLG